MRQAVLKSLYDLHSWIGVFLGMILYVVLFSGSVSLFVQELEPWTQGAADTVAQVDPKALDHAVAQALAEMPAEEGKGANFYIMLPEPYRSSIEIRPSRGDHVWRFDPSSGNPRPYREDGLADVLERVHTDLLLPSPYGRWIVGLTGIIFLISIVSGIFLHRKILREFFVMRLGRSVRLKWTDLHKSVSTWSLPFAIVLGLTGAMLGISQPVLMASAFISYDGDVARAARDLYGANPQIPEGGAGSSPVSAILATARRSIPDYRPDQIILSNYGGTHAVATVLGNIPGSLVYYPSVEIDARNARPLRVINWNQENWPKALFASFAPLHYASFGGFSLKLLYALLGIGTSISVATGFQIWRRRAYAEHHGEGGMAKLSTGIFYGYPLACGALLVAGRVLTGAEFATYSARMAFFLGACLIAVGWSYMRGAVRARNEQLLALGLCLAALPFLSLWSLGAKFADAMRWPLPPLLAVDLVCALSGAALLLIYRRLAMRPRTQ